MKTHYLDKHNRAFINTRRVKYNRKKFRYWQKAARKYWSKAIKEREQQMTQTNNLING